MSADFVARHNITHLSKRISKLEKLNKISNHKVRIHKSLVIQAEKEGIERRSKK